MAMLQRSAGNGAVAALLAGRSAQAEAPAETLAAPASTAETGADGPSAAPPPVPVQRSGGLEPMNALIAGRMRFPSKQSAADLDGGIRELHRDEPAIGPVEKGLKAAKALGVPVDLEGIRPPASALAVTTTGFGPGSVAAKKPVPPPKKTPAISPLGRAGAKRAAGPRTGGEKARAAPTGGTGPEAPVTEALSGDLLLQPPVRPSLVRPEQDPAFTKVTGAVKATSKQKRAHPPAASKAKEAQDAALPPSGDIGSQAKAAKADTMEAQRPGSFDKQAFIAAVKAAIEARSPKTLKEADNVKKSGQTGEVKGEVKALVTQGKEGQAVDIKAATEAAPDQSKAVPKPVTPMGPEPPGQAAIIPATGAVPKPAPADQLNLAAGKHEADTEMAEGGISEQQLAESNEPEFEGALADKKSAAAHADTAPGEFRQQEAQVIAQGKAEAGAETAKGADGMQGARGAALAKLVADKGKTKTKDEAKRAEVTTKVTSIFDATEADVKQILDGIDPLVESVFNAGEVIARMLFENYVAGKMAAYKEDRYGGWLGPLRWVRDKIRGMPPKVNEFYVAGRELYLKQMDKVIAQVADIVGRQLGAAKLRIAKGQGEIATYVASLPKDLKKIGGEATKDIGERFEQLESDVDAKQDALVDTLATKYVEARKGLDARIEELQAENRGLIDKAIGAIKAVINTIRALVSMLVNVLLRAASLIGDIIAHPIRFLSTLVSGVKDGFLMFKERFLDHLRKGLMRWLFGALAEGGVDVPAGIDPQSIVTLLASIFGLTWDKIRKRLVRDIGEPAMAAVEKGVEIFTILAGPEGVGGLWQKLLTHLGDVKGMIFNAVKSFVQDRLISAGIGMLLSMLNPAAAFVKACKMIYSIVMFFVDNKDRIGKLLDTILDSVADMVRGNASAVANKINDVLGQLVPVMIGFLASLVGLDGIGQKVREIITKLQKPVNAALDVVIKAGLKMAGPIIRGVRGVSEKVKAKVASGKAWVKGKADTVGAKLKQIFAGKSANLEMDGKAHTLSIAGPPARLKIASVPAPLRDRLADRITALRGSAPTATSEIASLQAIQVKADEVEKHGDLVAAAQATSLRNKHEADLDVAIRELALLLREYGKKYHVKDLQGGAKPAAPIAPTIAGAPAVNSSIRLKGVTRKEMTDDVEKWPLAMVTEVVPADPVLGGTDVGIHWDKAPYSPVTAGTGVKPLSQKGKSWRLAGTVPVDARGAAYEAIAHLNVWSGFDDARQVLNRRHHGNDRNPSELQWHHIHEQSSNGPNSVDNLVLISRVLNGELGRWFNQPMGAVTSAATGNYLAGTGKLKLRDYLKSQSAAVNREWGLHALVLLEGVRPTPMQGDPANPGPYQLGR